MHRQSKFLLGWKKGLKVALQVLALILSPGTIGVAQIGMLRLPEIVHESASQWGYVSLYNRLCKITCNYKQGLWLECHDKQPSLDIIHL